MNRFALALAAAAIASAARAQAGEPSASPRARLKEAVAQLQTSPDDASLREKIIALAKKVRPAPALPREAERRMNRGIAAFKEAKTAADFEDAVREFEQASLVAPWSGDVYFNLGMARDKAGDAPAALRALKLAQLASPENADARKLLDEVEYRAEKASSPAAVAARHARQEQDQEAAVLKGLDGAVVAAEPVSVRLGFKRRDEIHVSGAKASIQGVVTEVWGNAAKYGYYVGQSFPEFECPVDSRHLACKSTSPSEPNAHVDLEVAADGGSITGDDGRYVYRRQ